VFFFYSVTLLSDNPTYATKHSIQSFVFLVSLMLTL